MLQQSFYVSIFFWSSFSFAKIVTGLCCLKFSVQITCSMTCFWCLQIAAISEQSSESANETPLTWKTFDMRSVVAATEDLFCFILSEKGWRVRVFLIQDIVKAADAFLEEEALPCICNKPEAKERFDTEVSYLILTSIKFNIIRFSRKAVISFLQHDISFWHKWKTYYKF